MTDLPVTVSADGSAKASADMLAFAAATKRAADEERRFTDAQKAGETQIAKLAQRAVAAERQRTDALKQRLAANRTAAQEFARMERESFGGGSGGGGAGGGFGGGHSSPGNVGMARHLARAVGVGGVGGGFIAGASALGPLGVAVAAVAVTARAMVASSERDEKAAEEVFRGRLALRDAIKEQVKSAQEAGISQFEKEAKARHRLLGAGVNDVDAKANALSKQGFTGGVEALAGNLNVRAKDRGATLEAAKIVAKLEGISLDEAMAAVGGVAKKRTGLSARGFAGFALGGLRGTSSGFVDDGTIGQELSRFNRSSVLSGNDLGDKSRAGVEAAKRGAAGNVNAYYDKQAQEISDPEGTARKKARDAANDEANALSAATAAASDFAEVMREAGRAVTFGVFSDGSKRRQQDEARAKSEAILSGSR